MRGRKQGDEELPEPGKRHPPKRQTQGDNEPNVGS